MAREQDLAGAVKKPCECGFRLFVSSLDAQTSMTIESRTIFDVAAWILGRVDEPYSDTDCGELNEAEEAGRELIVAGRNAA